MKSGECRDHGFLVSVAAKALLGILLGGSASMSAQQVYDNHEDITKVKYYTRPDDRVEIFTANPAPDSVNGSKKCAKFERIRQRYDYIKIVPAGKLEDVQPYASYAEEAPKFKMKIFTNAPAGSVVELQLGKADGQAYPDGTHSQFQAVTTTSGAWEEIEFKFAQTPKGSRTRAKDVDQITLLFMPNTTATFTFYFDDLSGPEVKVESSVKIWRRK